MAQTGPSSWCASRTPWGSPADRVTSMAVDQNQGLKISKTPPMLRLRLVSNGNMRMLWPATSCPSASLMPLLCTWSTAPMLKCWDGHLHSKSRTGQSHAQGFSRTSLDITKGALNAPGQLQTIYRHREHMLAHGLTGLVHTYIPRTIWLCPYGQSMDYFYTWGWLLYDQTVSEWCVYLRSLWSLSYMHTPSFYTYTYTFLRFRVCMKS